MRERRSEARKPQQKGSQQRSSRAVRAPLPPSWRRATKRALLIGAFIFIVMYLLNGKATGRDRLLGALEITVLYTLLFIPFTYYTDRYGYRRWERKMAAEPTKKR
jgi:hypothetical protein